MEDRRLEQIFPPTTNISQETTLMKSEIAALSNRKLDMAAIALAVFAILIMAAFAIPASAQTYNVNFPAPATFAVAPCCNDTVAAATGDLNGDGNLDVVNIDSNANINVMLGKGDGTFQEPITSSINTSGFFPEAIAVGDFNGDHVLDLAVWAVNSTGVTQVNIYLGRGTGNFTTGATYTAPGSNNFNPGPNSIVAADVNGDGKLDLVAMTPYNGVFVFLGNGDGTFQTPVANATVCTEAIGNCQSVAVGDLNGDGKPDLAFESDDTVGGGISILLNTGNGTFSSGAYYPIAISGTYASSGIAIGDLNGDKKLDVVVGSSNVTAIVYLNQGDGTFKVNGTVGSVGLYATNNVVLADINNDKKLDILVPDGFGNVYTFFGTGKGKFTAGPTYPLEVSGSGNSLVAVGDFNGDGTLDLLDTANYTTNSVSLGRGDGSFRTVQFYPFAVEGQYQNIAVADFNGDGIPDVAAQGATAGTIAVTLGAAHGTLAAKQLITSVCTNTFTYGIAAGDVNGDGKPDVVAVFGGGSDSCNHEVAVLIGSGTGKFKKALRYPTGAGTNAQELQVYLADVNGDGKLDIVISNSDGTISVLLNKGNGTYGAPNLITSIASINPYDNQLTFADFDGDGKLDIAVGLNDEVDAAAVEVLLGNGNGTFGAPIQTALPTFLLSLVAGDFNKDGKQDLFVETSGYGCTGGAASGYIYLQGNGKGNFAPGTQQCDFYSGIGAPIAADMNGDGDLDVIIPYSVSDFSHSGIAILQGNGNGTFEASQIYYAGNSLRGAGVADFNGDGMPDVATLNAGNVDFVSIMLNATQPVSISPLSVNYSSVSVGSKKAETIILTNDQSTSLAISGLTLGGTDPGDFKETSTCKTSREPGWDCTITVTFEPTTTGARTATLNIKDSAGTQTVTLSGTGK
jgi:hypothetical protein